MNDTSVDVLTDDEILVIFSLLSLADRGRAARVCKRWNRLMKNSTLWKCIDLWDSRLHHASDDTSMHPISWSFARNEKQVLEFLKTYVGSALREIYLHTVSDNILLCLCAKCPDLQFISFSSAFSLLSSKIPTDVNLSFLPINIQEVVLAVQRGRKRGRKLARGARVGRFLQNSLLKLRSLTMRDIRFDFELFRRISCCENLKRLELSDCFDLTENGFILLTSRIPDIQEIRLENCRYGLGVQGIANVSNELTGILQYISKHLTQIKLFHLLSNVEISRLPLNEFLGTLASFSTLRSVGFRRVRGFTFAGFQNIVKYLTHIEELEISQSSDVTDEILQLVSKYMRHLQVLKVPMAVNVTNSGVLTFRHHPCLTMANFAFCDRVSGEAMYNTFVSIRNLQQVILSSRSNPMLLPLAEKIRRDMPNLTIKEV